MRASQNRLMIAVALLASATIPLVASGSLGAVESAAEIHIKNFTFGPAALKIKAGTTVTWINDDEEPHNVVNVGQPTRVFRSGGIDGDGRYSFTFDKTGTYEYVCAVHPFMHGEVVVQ